MLKRLSKGGVTNFKVNNIDYVFIIEALDKYKKYVEASDFSKNQLMTKQFVLDRVKSLQETFKIEQIKSKSK